MTTDRATADQNRLAHKPGDRLEVFERGEWVPCVILRVASYVGKSGPGYYASYDPPSDRCASFWCSDRALRGRSS